MNIDKETKIILHIENGYFAKIEIRDCPDAPEFGFEIEYCEDKQKSVFNLQYELLEPLIDALIEYKNAKIKKQ